MVFDIEGVGQRICELTLRWFEESEFPEQPECGDAFTEIVVLLHYHNYSIWVYENYSASNSDVEVVFGRRGSMKHNQSRNVCIERLDELFVEYQKGQGELTSESPGGLVDRISVLLLRQFFLTREGIRKSDLDLLSTQLSFLKECFIRLMHNLSEGSSQIRVFRQMKRYGG